jgi:ActR/RegA family two-component response regulator
MPSSNSPARDRGGGVALDRREHVSAESRETWSLARVEDEHIRHVLAACGGNKSEAARRLGITRRTLQRKVLPPISSRRRG